MRYSVDPFSVLFHLELDARNNYCTVVYNWQKQNVLKVNRFGYELLRILDENIDLSLDELCESVSQKYKSPPWQIKPKITKFIKQMIKENVIREKD